MLIEYHSSYEKFVRENIEMINKIEKEIGINYTPSKEKIFLFMNKDIAEVKVTILGQDPYPQEGVATGRSFEVGNLKSWEDSFKQVSLKNIVRLIYKSYSGELLKYSEIKEKIKDKSFNILNPDELFKNWDMQGVLMLNKYLTCEINKPGSHEKIWNDFSEKLIEYISVENKNISWFLWGEKSISNEKFIKNGNIIKASHPRINDTKKDSDFLNSNCFLQTKDIIDWRGKTM